MTIGAISLTLENRLDELEGVKDRIVDFCRSLGLNKKTTFQILFSVEEIFVNIVSYGYRDPDVHYIDIDLTHQDDALALRFVDDGVHFNPLEADPPDLEAPLEKRPVGGLGLHLTKYLMNEIAYEREGDKNVLTLIKHLNEPDQCLV
jgi:anti-sigma regulatory factor (Ser/Thr protein kinase)